MEKVQLIFERLLALFKDPEALLTALRNILMCKSNTCKRAKNSYYFRKRYSDWSFHSRCTHPIFHKINLEFFFLIIKFTKELEIKYNKRKKIRKIAVRYIFLISTTIFRLFICFPIWDLEALLPFFGREINGSLCMN